MRAEGPGVRLDAAGNPSGSRRADAIALALLAGVLTILFFDLLIGDNSLYIRDISHAAYPARMMLRNTLAGGEFPYWNRWISAGQPMAANPAHAVFYPLTWLILLPDARLGFTLMLLLHIYIAAGAMYALLRSMTVQPPAAFFGALSFALGGACLSLLDLLPLLLSFAWLPLSCLFARRFLRQGAPRDFALAALFFGIQALLGEISILLQTGFILGLYALHIGAKQGGMKTMAHAVAGVGLLSVAAAALAAVQLLPAIDLAATSVRALGFPFERVTSWSLPVQRLGEWFHPSLLGHHVLEGRRVYWAATLYPGRGIPFLNSIYPGILITVLAITGFLAGARGRRVVVTIVGISIALALGAHTPIWRFLYDAGLARSIRYPEKFILMGLFALTVFGALVLDRMLAGETALRRMALITAGTIAVTLAAIALISSTPLYLRLFVTLWGQPPAHIFPVMLAASRSGWILAAARAALLFLVLRNLDRVRRARWLTLLGVVVLLDLSLLLPELAPRMPASYFQEAPRIARQLPADRNSWRLFHVATWQTRQAGPYFTPQPDLYWIHRNAMYPMMPATWGIRTVIEPDFDRTALAPTAEFVDAVWALSRRRADWPDVVGAMSNAWYAALYVDPAEAFARAKGDPREVQPVQLAELTHTPRYYFADQVETIRDSKDFVDKLTSGVLSRRVALTREPGFRPSPGVVQRVHETANTARIEVATRGRAFLVISVTPHKYWKITLDGAEVRTIVTNLGYQGVNIPGAGSHVVKMSYRNPLVLSGGIVSLATLTLLIALIRRRS